MQELRLCFILENEELFVGILNVYSLFDFMFTIIWTSLSSFPKSQVVHQFAIKTTSQKGITQLEETLACSTMHDGW
jgi:hypothetical protein